MASTPGHVACSCARCDFTSALHVSTCTWLSQTRPEANRAACAAETREAVPQFPVLTIEEIMQKLQHKSGEAPFFRCLQVSLSIAQASMANCSPSEQLSY